MLARDNKYITTHKKQEGFPEDNIPPCTKNYNLLKYVFAFQIPNMPSLFNNN